jgi:hypothetical protein
MNWKKIMAGVMLAAVASVVPANAITVGGAIPVINDFYSFGNTGLDVDAANTVAAKSLMSIFVNNNTAGGFVLTATSTSGGFNKPGVAVPALNAAAGTHTPYTELTMIAGTLVAGAGTGGTWAAPTGLTTMIVAAPVAGSSLVWTSGTQATATSNYEVLVQAKWAANAGMLAGIYTDSWTISLIATL